MLCYLPRIAVEAWTPAWNVQTGMHGAAVGDITHHECRPCVGARAILDSLQHFVHGRVEAHHFVSLALHARVLEDRLQAQAAPWPVEHDGINSTQRALGLPSRPWRGPAIRVSIIQSMQPANMTLPRVVCACKQRAWTRASRGRCHTHLHVNRRTRVRRRIAMKSLLSITYRYICLLYKAWCCMTAKLASVLQKL
jgi:hypothetical protein